MLMMGNVNYLNLIYFRSNYKDNKMAKKIKKSKFNVTGQDPLTEQMYGEGAIRLADCRMDTKMCC